MSNCYLQLPGIRFELSYFLTHTDTADITPPVAIVAAQNEPLLLECDFQAARPPDVAEWSFNGMNITKDICKAST